MAKIWSQATFEVKAMIEDGRVRVALRLIALMPPRPLPDNPYQTLEQAVAHVTEATEKHARETGRLKQVATSYVPITIEQDEYDKLVLQLALDSANNRI